MCVNVCGVHVRISVWCTCVWCVHVCIAMYSVMTTLSGSLGLAAQHVHPIVHNNSMIAELCTALSSQDYKGSL